MNACGRLIEELTMKVALSDFQSRAATIYMEEVLGINHKIYATGKQFARSISHALRARPSDWYWFIWSFLERAAPRGEFHLGELILPAGVSKSRRHVPNKCKHGQS
jgi:hypothetical protein